MSFEFYFQDKKIIALEGQTVAAALVANGITVFRYSRKLREPRSLFCGMGVCFECAMNVDGIPNVRICTIYARPGMRIYNSPSNTIVQ